MRPTKKQEARPRPSSSSSEELGNQSRESQSKRKQASTGNDERGGRDIEDNGFAPWGGYMSAKKQKLDKQFNVTTKGLRTRSKEKPSNAPPDLFKDITVHINGFTYPPEPELREIFIKHGGTYTQYASASTTFIIATTLATATKKKYGTKTLKPEWITDSVKAGVKLDHRAYYLYNLNQENKQQTLTQAFSNKFQLKPLSIDLVKVDPTQLDNSLKKGETSQDENKAEVEENKNQNESVAQPNNSKVASKTQSVLNSDSDDEVLIIEDDSDDDNDILPATQPELQQKVQQLKISDKKPLQLPQKEVHNLSTASKEPNLKPISSVKPKLTDRKKISVDTTSKAEVTVIPPSPPLEDEVESLESEKLQNNVHVHANDMAVESTISLTTEVPVASVNQIKRRPGPASRTLAFNKQNSTSMSISSPAEIPAASVNQSTRRPGPASAFNKQNDTSMSIRVTPKPASKMKTAAEDGFLREFYNNSRLHLIATLKKERQQNVTEWRKNLAAHKFTLLDKYKKLLETNKEFAAIDDDIDYDNLQEQILFHIDLDCFFVSVARLSRPELNNKPIVITHSKGADSKSDIACASYEARDKGISAGMWLFQAKELCPDVTAVPYEFDEYSRVSKLFYEAVASLTLEMEAISCDEMLINVTKLVKGGLDGIRLNPLHLAQFLVEEISNAIGVKASIGIGINRLIAKISTREAKDKKLGCYFMKLLEAQEHLRNQPVTKLPGVGWALNDKLEELNVKTGGELQKLSLEELKSQFGEKTGQKLYSICRGIDSDDVKTDLGHAKSLSAGCSFGVRLSNTVEFEKFIKEVASEVASRANSAKCYCNKITLQLWIAKKGYEKETVKPGGHGVSYVQSKGISLLQKTRDPALIGTTALELARNIMLTTIPPEHIRGVLISLDGLIYDSDLSEKERKSKQTTLLDQVKKYKKDQQQQEATTSARDQPDKQATTVQEELPATSKNVRPGSSTSSTISTSGSKSSNPYSELQELDPDYLAALPDEFRAEVLLDFQKAKNNQPTSNGNSSNNGKVAIPSTSKKISKKPSPKKKLLKSPSKTAKASSPKGKGVTSPSKNGLYRYYKLIQNAKKPLPEKGKVEELLQQRRFDSESDVDRRKAGEADASSSSNGQISKDLIVGFNKDQAGAKLAEAATNGTPTSYGSISIIEDEEVQLIPESNNSQEMLSATELDRPEDYQVQAEEIDKEFQQLLTAPKKKSSHEVEQMILSFTEEKSNDSSSQSQLQPGGTISKSNSTEDDTECGQPLIRPRKKKLSSPRAGSSKSCRPAATAAADSEDIEMQQALLQSYLQSEEQGDFEEADERAASLANNVDSDRDDDDFMDTTIAADADEIELPPLNGVTEITKVHEMIRKGITNREPLEDDVDSLTTYFHDLASTFLTQTSNSLRFLQALQSELSQKGGSASKQWIDVFESIITVTRKRINEEFGGMLC